MGSKAYQRADTLLCSRWGLARLAEAPPLQILAAKLGSRKAAGAQEAVEDGLFCHRAPRSVAGPERPIT